MQRHHPMKRPAPGFWAPAALATPWRDCWVVVLALGVAVSAVAQSPSPAELAAKAMDSAPVRAVLQNTRPTGPSTAERLQKEHEAQLAAIRQAILDATLDRPTRVISSAWVDDKGALHEAAHFHSEAQVQGVRVLSYLQGDEPQTQVSAEVLPWGWKPVGGAATCTAPPRPWRLPLGVQVAELSGFSGPQQFAGQTLLGLAQQAWTQQMQSSQRWRTQTLAPTPAPSVDNPYMRALLGQTDERSGWMAEMALQPHAPATTRPRPWTERLHWGEPTPEWRWTLSLRLGQKHSPGARFEPQWQIEQVISVAPLALSQSPAAWAQRLQSELQTHMQQWVAQLDKRTECEPVQFHVRRSGGPSLELQAGLDSGLRPGDRVLLMNPSHVPSRMLEPGVAQHLALAQVVKVGPHRTELQQLAGPALAPQGAWMALPL